MKSLISKSIITSAVFLSSTLAFGEIIPTTEDIKTKCEATVFEYFKKDNENFDAEGRCGFEDAYIINVLYKGETVSVLEVATDVCGGSGVDETVINNKTCEVVTTRMVHSD